MNRFIRYFFLLFCLLPKLAVGMDVVVESLSGEAGARIYNRTELVKDDTIKAEILKEDAIITETIQNDTVNEVIAKEGTVKEGTAKELAVEDQSAEEERVSCGVYSKKAAKTCFKPFASCLHGVGRGCSSCAEGSFDFVTSSSGGPATLCCLGVCCCPIYTPVIIAAAGLFVGFAIPCCCYIPCYCTYACYDFNKDD